MTDAQVAQAGVARTAARFPEVTAALLQLSLANLAFRELCVEYGLAQEGLARFVALSGAAERPEVDDYRSVIAELECEIRLFLSEAAFRG